MKGLCVGAALLLLSGCVYSKAQLFEDSKAAATAECQAIGFDLTTDAGKRCVADGVRQKQADYYANKRVVPYFPPVGAR